MIGGAVDPEGRCVHWDGPTDVVAFGFPCCAAFWACRDCHDDAADHAAVLIEAGALAVQCGVCRSILSEVFYRGRTKEACPQCGAQWNPGCRDHEPRYFA